MLLDLEHGMGVRRRRVNVALTRQSKPDYDLGFQVKVPKTFMISGLDGSGAVHTVSSRKGALVGPPQEVSKNRNLLDRNRQLEGA